jgi:hypothetical protein
MAKKAADKPTTSALPWSTPTVIHIPQAHFAAANLVGEGTLQAATSQAHSISAALRGESSLQAKVLRNPRIVDDTTDIDVGQGNQTRRVQQALNWLQIGGLVLREHSRPELRRRILKYLATEAKRTGASDLPPSRQVMDRELLRLGIR